MAPNKRVKKGVEIQCEQYPGTCPCPDKVFVPSADSKRPCPPPMFPPCPNNTRLMNHPYYNKDKKMEIVEKTIPAPKRPCPPPLFGPKFGMHM